VISPLGCIIQRRRDEKAAAQTLYQIAVHGLSVKVLVPGD
jgi:hypothetical protein